MVARIAIAAAIGASLSMSCLATTGTDSPSETRAKAEPDAPEPPTPTEPDAERTDADEPDAEPDGATDTGERKTTGKIEKGKATWYGGKWHGRKTANGEIYDKRTMTAAHKTLPFDTIVEVTNLNNGKTVTLRINNRGPYGKGRIIDVSEAAAEQLDMIDAGVVPCTVEVLELGKGKYKKSPKKKAKK